MDQLSCMEQVFTTFEHSTQPDGRIVTQVTSNDDDDDGYVDREGTQSYTLGPSLKESALRHPMDYTHLGAYGQPVRVFLDGNERIKP